MTALRKRLEEGGREQREKGRLTPLEEGGPFQKEGNRTLCLHEPNLAACRRASAVGVLRGPLQRARQLKFRLCGSLSPFQPLASAIAGQRPPRQMPTGGCGGAPTRLPVDTDSNNLQLRNVILVVFSNHLKVWKKKTQNILSSQYVQKQETDRIWPRGHTLSSSDLEPEIIPIAVCPQCPALNARLPGTPGDGPNIQKPGEKKRKTD